MEVERPLELTAAEVKGGLNVKLAVDGLTTVKLTVGRFRFNVINADVELGINCEESCVNDVPDAGTGIELLGGCADGPLLFNKPFEKLLLVLAEAIEELGEWIRELLEALDDEADEGTNGETPSENFVLDELLEELNDELDALFAATLVTEVDRGTTTDITGRG